MKTRINLYLDSSLGEAFKRFCRSHRMSYSEVMERIIYRYLISPQSKDPHSESSLTTIQERIHDQAVNAYRDVYETHRQEVIDTAITDSEADSVDEVSPTIPMPYPTSTEVNHYGTRAPRTKRLSKREISR